MLNLTVMVLAVTGPGMEVPENVWVKDPLLTSTVSQCVSNAANVSVTGSPVVDSSVHSYNIELERHERIMETSGLPLHNYWDRDPGS